MNGGPDKPKRSSSLRQSPRRAHCPAYAVAVVLAAGVLVLGVGLITRQAQKNEAHG